MVKLRGGEYVSLTKVETAISKSSIVENCCLCASSSAEHTVALICPKPKEMEVSLLKLVSKFPNQKQSSNI